MNDDAITQILQGGPESYGWMERLRLGLGDQLERALYGLSGEAVPPSKKAIVEELLKQQNPLRKFINPDPVPNPDPALPYPPTGGVRG